MSTYLVTHTATVKDSSLNVFSPLGSLVDRPFCQIDFIAHLKREKRDIKHLSAVNRNRRIIVNGDGEGNYQTNHATV